MPYPSPVTMSSAAATAAVDSAAPPRAVQALGSALCVSTDFGPLILKPGDLITDHVIRSGCWDEHIVALARSRAAADSVAIDAGAHFGTLSCALATYFRQVHAFEANEDNVRYLQANAALRPFGQIVVHHTGLYSRATQISLAGRDLQEVRLEAAIDERAAFRQASNSGGLMFVAGGSGVNAISAVTLDSFALEDVGFLKIDCQGADGEVLLGAVDTIARCRPVVVFEWEEQLARSHSRTLVQTQQTLTELGYRLEILRDHNGKQVDYVAMPVR